MSGSMGSSGCGKCGVRKASFGHKPLNSWATGDKNEQTIWNVRGYDFNVQTQKKLLEKLDYCHKNPLTRGLVDRGEDWAWSSYRYYEFGDESVLKMDWDGSWPIIW